MRDLVILVVFVAMLPAGVLATNVGAMIWAWVALVSPNEYAYGLAGALPYNKLAVAMTVLSLVVGKVRNKFYVDAHFVVLTIFVMICMLAFAFGLSDLDRASSLADRLIKIYALCVVLMACLQTRQQIHGVILAICMGAGIHGVLEGLKYALSAGHHIVLGPRSFGDNNNFGLLILMTIPLLIYAYRYAAHPVARFALLGAVAANVVAVVATASRGALVGLVAVAIGIALRSKRKVSAMVVIGLAGVLIVAFAPDKWTKRMDTIATAENDDSFMSRVVSWKMNASVAVDRPLGAGFSGLEDRRVFEAYRFRVNSLIPFFEVTVPTIAYAAHSIYFQVLGDNGFLGLFLFIAILSIGFANLRKIRRLTKGHAHLSWAYDLANTLWTMMIAYVVAGAALSMAYFELFYMVITLISVLLRLVRSDPLVQAALQPALRQPVAARARSYAA